MKHFTTTTSLYTHQRTAADKLIRPRVGALFMDMGTGKTRSAIDLVARRQRRVDHAIVYCPVSLKETWRREILKHTDCPETAVHVFDDNTTMRNVPAASWHIVGTESMSASDRVVLAANALTTEDSFVIVDESTYIKGHNSRRTRRITSISERARYRLALTGTPLSQGVEDLYAQMAFLSPQILGYNSFYSFAANHLEYSEKYPGMVVRAHNTEWLAAKIAPYTYQVTKAECLDLPPKIYETRYHTLTWQQREAYEQAKYEILLSLPDEQIDSYVIFQLFGALQQIVSGYWNRRLPDGRVEHLTFPHTRLYTLAGVIGSIPAGEKIVIWCKYHHSIQAIVEMLAADYGRDAVAQFHGELNEVARNREADRFRCEAKFFVATQASGGHGLTLVESHQAIFYENEFKYANRIQAEDRIHRIGQEAERVTYTDIVASGTIDDRIMASLAKKENTLDAFRREVDAVKDDKALIREMIKRL